MEKVFVTALAFFLVVAGSPQKTKKPNIVMIVADDLGWNDVGFHGSKQIPTPNIDRLATEGIILNNYYVLPICTPTRSAIMTGRYGIHTGMQTSTIFAPNAWAVGLNETFLPQHLKSLGYKTHAIGKWHLGFYAKEFTPTYRGFDSFYGYYEGKSDYWSHGNYETYWGLDLHDNMDPVYNQWGNYSTEMYTAETEARIRDHDTSEPLFIYLAYQAVHSANTPADPIQAPASWIKKFSHIKSEGRRKFAAVTAYMDYGIGRVYDALSKKGILDNTVIVFTTDNGGPSNGFDFNYANNWPLRGVKASVWEGGVRAVGFIHSKLLKSPGRVSMDLFHCTDWLPTLVSIAGGDIPAEGSNLDGYSIWNSLQNDTPSPRSEVLLNIDPFAWKNAALRVGDWKIVEGQGRSWGGWYNIPDSTMENHIHFYPTSNGSVKCGPVPENPTYCDKDHGPCLFNVNEDPCEFHDLSKTEPELMHYMMTRLDQYRKTMVPSRRNQTTDPLSNPKLHNGVWVPWRKP